MEALQASFEFMQVIISLFTNHHILYGMILLNQFINLHVKTENVLPFSLKYSHMA